MLDMFIFGQFSFTDAGDKELAGRRARSALGVLRNPLKLHFALHQAALVS